MKKNLFLTSVLIVFFLFTINAQTTFNFESLTVPASGYWNGSDESGEFGDNEITFYNNYNNDWGSWTKFSYTYDTITSDTQYAAYAESIDGHIFGIGYVPSDWESGTYDNIPITCKFNSPVEIHSVDIANNTKTADVIINGDDAFGEPAFSDGDYFKIMIEGFYNGESQGVVSFFLADYTAGNTYVSDTWNTVNLNSFGMTDSLKFNLYSTHTGAYGMNTPAYFCIDNIVYSYPASIDNNQSNSFSIYPNPVKNILNITNIINSEILISNLSGKIIYTKTNCNESEKINLSNVKSGIYFIKIKNKNKIFIKKFIKS